MIVKVNGIFSLNNKKGFKDEFKEDRKTVTLSLEGAQVIVSTPEEEMLFDKKSYKTKKDGLKACTIELGTYTKVYTLTHDKKEVEYTEQVNNITRAGEAIIELMTGSKYDRDYIRVQKVLIISKSSIEEYSNPETDLSQFI